jgi:hypothetical protein
MRFRTIVLSTFTLALGVYILYPTPDELFIHPALGLLFSEVFNIPIYIGILLSIVIYRAIGFVCLGVALLTGGKPIYRKLKEKMKKFNGKAWWHPK